MPITEHTIRNLATAQSYQKGEDYYYTNAIIEILKRGNSLIAEVEGSSYEPYRVTIELTEDEILSAACTCPYDWGGVCKHIVAVLLMYLHQPERIEEHPSVEELVAGLSEKELREVLTELLTAEPHLIARAEAHVGQREMKPASPSARPTLIDPAAFRRQVQQIMRGAEYRDPYTGGWEIAAQISKLIEHAQPFLDAGDGTNALLVLKAIIEPLMGCWYDYDYEGEVGEVFVQAGPLFTEAILSAELSKEERKSWSKRFKKWQQELDDYGVDGVFDAAIEAAEQGWEYTPLQAVLQGNITNEGAWEDEAPMYADELAVARLNVLERQGRTQEYLYLAEAEGQTALYLTMLVKLGRSAEAVQYALQYVATADEILILAQALDEYDHPTEAMTIAEFGLTLQHGEVLPLARWLRDAARNASQPDVALKAARLAFRHSLSMDDYVAVEVIAGAEWPALKPELLEQLASAQYAFARIDIYLHEDMFQKAMQAVDARGHVDYGAVGKVVDAVWEVYPDWAIERCKQQAEAIMNQGKSKYYHHAIHWLEKAAQTYRAANRIEEWNAYLAELLHKHARKYSLRPQLEALSEPAGT